MKIVTRTQLLDKLNQWAAGTLSSVDMHAWAANLHASGVADFDDWEGDHRFSVSKEVVEELYMLDMNLLTSGDVPFFVSFLNTPRDQFEKGYIDFVSHLHQIDHKKRQDALKAIEPYVKYCRA